MEPQIPTKKGNRGYCKYPDGSMRGFVIADEVSFPQSNNPDKYFAAHLLRYDDGSEEIRVGYYIKGKKPRMKGKWTWGQYCPFFPKPDLKKLVDLLHEKAWV